MYEQIIYRHGTIYFKFYTILFYFEKRSQNKGLNKVEVTVPKDSETRTRFTSLFSIRFLFYFVFLHKFFLFSNFSCSFFHSYFFPQDLLDLRKAGWVARRETERAQKIGAFSEEDKVLLITNYFTVLFIFVIRCQYFKFVTF